MHIAAACPHLKNLTFVNISSSAALLSTTQLQFWRYISYSLVHASNVHLITNCVMQLALGLPLEAVHGTARTLLLYTFSAIAGALNVTAFTPNFTVVGASGAIYGLLGVAVANLALNWAEMPLRWARLIIMTLFIANDGFMYLYAYDPFTSYSAHFGGFVFGFLFGFPILKNIVVTRCEKLVVAAALLLGCCAMGVWMAWYFLHPVPLAMIKPSATCCTNILRYGLPEGGVSNEEVRRGDEPNIVELSNSFLSRRFAHRRRSSSA